MSTLTDTVPRDSGFAEDGRSYKREVCPAADLSSAEKNPAAPILGLARGVFVCSLFWLAVIVIVREFCR